MKQMLLRLILIKILIQNFRYIKYVVCHVKYNWFLKPTKSLDSDSLTSASESQVIKDKPSLFDSLLSGNKSDTTANLNNTEEINPKSKLEQTKSDKNRYWKKRR